MAEGVTHSQLEGTQGFAISAFDHLLSRSFQEQ